MTEEIPRECADWRSWTLVCPDVKMGGVASLSFLPVSLWMTIAFARSLWLRPAARLESVAETDGVAGQTRGNALITKSNHAQHFLEYFTGGSYKLHARRSTSYLTRHRHSDRPGRVWCLQGMKHTSRPFRQWLSDRSPAISRQNAPIVSHASTTYLAHRSEVRSSVQKLSL